ncbi:MAG: cysteine--tRNA ligase [Candidatus Cloacimonadota bacterium]|nr:MAG: cysteine--tRNA ligase [Candidatus Cloacimonadota bacterium]
MTLQLKISNTLSGKKETFKPLEDGKIGIYACGVTVYDKCHIGHAMQAILFDVIVRYLTLTGYDVTYVRNYTDVDDKIINRAFELGITPLELSSKMIKSSEDDLNALRIKPATHQPKVSDFISEIIAFIQDLMDKGFAYATLDGDVYYRVRKKDDYGKLSNQNPDALRSNVRVDGDNNKEDSLDFALWKSETKEGAFWSSPFGDGRPGWHIECSAMALQFLGYNFDIHGGGRDLVFPHHENEIAQSEARSGCNYANYWIHTGLLTVEKKKMSKSVGNFLTIEDALKLYDFELIRWNVYQNHYSSNLDFNEKTFGIGLKKLYYFYRTLSSLNKLLDENTRYDEKLLEGFHPQSIRENFDLAMHDDFNIPKAMVSINEAFGAINEIIELKGVKQKLKLFTLKKYKEVLQPVLEVLELCQRSSNEFFKEIHNRYFDKLDLSLEMINDLLTKRLEARVNKDYEESDKLRNELESFGISVMDTPKGQVWELSEVGLQKLVQTN